MPGNAPVGQNLESSARPEPGGVPAVARRRSVQLSLAAGLVLAVAIAFAVRLRVRRPVRPPADDGAEPKRAAPGSRSAAKPHGSAVGVREIKAPLCESEQEPSFWADFAEQRLLKLPDDSPALRRVVYAVGVMVLLAAGVIAAGAHFPSATVLVRTSLAGPQLARISWAALALGAASTVTAWILILSGVFLAEWKVRLPGLFLLTAGALAERHFLPRLSVFGGDIGIAALAVVIVLGILTAAVDCMPRRRRPKVDMEAPARTRVVVITVILLVSGAYLGQAVRLVRHGSIGSLALRSVSGFELLYITIILVTPMLLIAGADIADMASEITEGIGKSMARRPVALAASTTALAAAGIAVAVYSLGRHFFVDLLLAALLIGLSALIVRTTRPYARWANSPLPVAAGAAIFVTLIVVQIATGVQKTPASSVIELSPPDTPFIHLGPPAFSIRYPHSCAPPKNNSKGRVTEFDIIGCNPAGGIYGFSFAVISFPRQAFPGRLSDACLIPRVVLGPNLRYVRGPKAQSWCTTVFANNGNRDIAWTRLIGSRAWLLLGQAINQPAKYHLIEPLLSLMRQYWRPTTAVAALVPAEIAGGHTIVDRFGARTGVLWIVLAAGGTLVLIWRRGRGPSRLKQALLYLVTAGVWVAVTFLQATSAAFRKAGHLLPRLEIGGVQALAGLAALGLVTVLIARRAVTDRLPSGNRPTNDRVIISRLGSLMRLNGGLLLVWGGAILYGQAARAGTMLAVYQGGVVVLALAWEFISSGEMLNSRKPTREPAAQSAPGVTGRDQHIGRWQRLMPQRARILAYLGYLLLTLSVVLQLGTLHSPAGGAHIELIGPENVVQIGIVGLGVPLVITIFLVSWVQKCPRGMRGAPGRAEPPPRRASSGAVEQ
jgi:hypothetical protein